MYFTIYEELWFFREAHRTNLSVFFERPCICHSQFGNQDDISSDKNLRIKLDQLFYEQARRSSVKGVKLSLQNSSYLFLQGGCFISFRWILFIKMFIIHKQGMFWPNSKRAGSLHKVLKRHCFRVREGISVRGDKKADNEYAKWQWLWGKGDCVRNIRQILIMHHQPIFD